MTMVPKADLDAAWQCIEDLKRERDEAREAMREAMELLAWHADDEADPENLTPEDMTAHINGCVRAILRRALEQMEARNGPA